MRISDWSSDVCSSDLLVRAPEAIRGSVPAQHPRHPQVAALVARVRREFDPAGIFETGRFLGEARADLFRARTTRRTCAGDIGSRKRKSVWWGKRVSERVDHRGGSICNKQLNKKHLG